MIRRAVSFIAIVFAAALLPTAPPASAGDVSHARIVRLSYVQGDVQVAPGAESAWQKAIVNTPIREGVKLATGEGRAEVEFESGAMAWISDNTVLEFPQLALDDGARLSQLIVNQGTATIYAKPGRHDSFVVQAGQLQIRVPSESRFRVDVFEDGASVSVSRGGVDVDVHGTLHHLGKNHTLGFRYDSPGDIALIPSPASDAWDTWVGQRQDAVDSARYAAYQYAPAQIGYGFADLTYYGGWFTLPGYGYVWRPWGVDLGWAPFTAGFWDPLDAWGPTWVSYEPWGWAPYHYGNWAFSPLYGWVWVPGAFGAWSPATVVFVRTPGAIGWVPRAPHDPVNGTPANMAHGIITNTAAGIAVRSPNSFTGDAAGSSLRVIRNWRDDADLVRMTQQASARAAGQGASAARTGFAAGAGAQGQDTAVRTIGPRPAMRMPAGPAPRLSAGAPPTPPTPVPSAARSGRSTTPAYHAPSSSRPSGGIGSTGSSSAGAARSSSAGSRSSSGSHGGAKP
jgi:hypothetical protein